MNLRKTVDGARGTYRIFEFAPDVFHVLDADGRTVDEFQVVELASHGSGTSIKRAVRSKPLRPGIPELATSFVAELNQARLRH